MEVHPVRKYRHLFFDLDHTLWDFRTNSRAVLLELHAELKMEERGIPEAGFVSVYEAVNAELWQGHDAGVVPKEVLRALRFRKALEHFGVKDSGLAKQLEETYLDRCPRRSALNPGAMELLRDLRPHCRMHIITNGFLETQALKLAASGIRPFFDVVLTSEQAGANKPSLRIFRHALRSAGAKAVESLMIGDNATADIAGARNAGMDQAHYASRADGDPQATVRFSHFDELREVLS
jgi:putative hydrolase of the HAD superfamily